MKHKIKLLTLSTILAFGLVNVNAMLIFSDDFSGTSGDLDGTMPDVGGVSWVASPVFENNGDANLGGTVDAGSATLAFTPSNGMLYTAEGSASLSAGGSGNFVTFGFANGQSNVTSTNNRFLNGNFVEGRAWMFARENTNNPFTYLAGQNDGALWSGLSNSPSNVDFKIELDTTGGSGAWTATWFAKDSASSTFTEVRSAATLTAEDITSVGFAVSCNGVTANLSNFSLTAVPEPSQYAMLFGAGSLLFIIIRRRRS